MNSSKFNNVINWLNLHIKVFSLIGFILMLLGPIILLALGWLLWPIVNDFSEFTLLAIINICLFLPGIGAILSLISLIINKKKEHPSYRMLSFVTLIMCNPFFYFYYFFICSVMRFSVAGIPWM